jgi:hypothetical protein
MYLSKKTKKLFFDRYLYKIAVRTPLASSFRGNDIDDTRNALDIYKDTMLRDGSTETLVGHSWNRVRVRLDEVYRDLAFTVLLEAQADSMIRIEGNIMSFYTNDETAIDTAAELYDYHIKEISKPADDKTKEFLLANPKSILREEFTHKYKVTIGPVDDATAFKQWASQLPKIKVMRNNYLLGGYFYVADLKTLSMCRLFLSNKIRRIDELRSYEEI